MRLLPSSKRIDTVTPARIQCTFRFGFLLLIGPAAASFRLGKMYAQNRLHVLYLYYKLES